MADKKIIKQIALSDGNYELDAKYWNGHEWSELAHAIKFIGKGVTTKPAAGNYKCAIVTVDTTSVTYYISITETGTATEIAAEQGDVFVVVDTSKEYICIKGGLSTANEWAELGDEGLYAKKSIAGKAGTYTSSAASTSSSGSAGAETAVGTATVSYMKSDAATGSTHGEASANTDAGGAVSIAYTPSGSISGSQTISAHSHGVNLTKATITYVDDVDANTGSAGEHSHSVTGKVTAAGSISVGTATVKNYTPAGSVSVSVNAHSYTPEGTISGAAVGNHAYTPEGTVSAVSASSHSHSVGCSKATITNNVTGTATGSAGAHTHSVSASGNYTPAGSIGVGEGTVNYTPDGSVSQPSFSNGLAASAGSHSHSVTAAGAISVGTGTANYTPAGSISQISHAAHSHTVNSHSHASNQTVISSLASTDIYQMTGVGSLPTITIESASTSNAVYDWEVVNGVLGLKKSAFVTAASKVSNWNAGSLPTRASVSVVNGVSDTVSVAGAYSAATLSTSSNGAYSVTPTFTGTPVELKFTGSAVNTNNVGAHTHSVSGTVSKPSFTGTGVELAFTGASATVSVSGAASTAGSHSHELTHADITYVSDVNTNTGNAGAFNVTPTFTGTAATLSHSVTQPSFAGKSVTLSHTASGSFSGTGVDLKFTGSSVDLVNGSAASAGGHSHTVGHSTATLNNVTGVTLNTAGSATIDFSKASFSGASVTLSQASHTHGYKKPADHTHTIGLTSTSVTGSAAVAVSNHTHSIGHTHTVVIPNCEN